MNVHKIGDDGLPWRAGLQLAGTSGVVSSNTQSVLRAVRQWVQPHGPLEGFALDVLVDVTLRPITGAPTFRGMDHLVFATFGCDRFNFDLRRKRITGVVCQQTAQDEKFWNLVFLPIAIGVMGCMIGVVPMHCACLEWKGQGVLVAGISGAGKSTLSAAMAQYGFAFVSDDWTYISAANNDLVAHGLNVPLKLLSDARRFFLLSESDFGRSMNGEWAFEFDASKIAAKVKTSTRPKHVLLLERSEQGSPQFNPLDPQLVRDFFERSSERLPPCLEEGRRLRSQVIDAVANLGCWRFSYSGSPHEAANVVRYFLEK